MTALIDLSKHVLYFEKDIFSIRSKESNSAISLIEDKVCYIFTDKQFMYTFNYELDGTLECFQVSLTDTESSASASVSVHQEDLILSRLSDLGVDLTIDMFTIDIYDVVTFFNPKKDISDECSVIKNRMNNENFNTQITLRELYSYINTDESKTVVNEYLENGIQ